MEGRASHVQTVGTFVGAAGSSHREDELCSGTKFVFLPGAHVLVVLKV